VELWLNPACSKWALVAHPRAIQRPVLTAGDGTTVVGRDPGALARVIAAEQR
jgi:arsenate reductase (glutaredoxin)